MPSVFFLHEEEKKALQKLPVDLQAAWADYVETETLDSYENEDQMEYRLSLVDVTRYPELKKLIEQIGNEMESGGDLSDSGLETLSDEALQMLYSGIGAIGVSTFIELGLKEARTEDHLDGLAALSRIRHGLLKSNQDYFSHA